MTSYQEFIVFLIDAGTFLFCCCFFSEIIKISIIIDYKGLNFRTVIIPIIMLFCKHLNNYLSAKIAFYIESKKLNQCII